MKSSSLHCCLTVLVGLFLALGNVPASHGALQAAGPINPANGFPSWYQDTTSMALELCLDPLDGFCLQPIPVPDPAKPVSFPGNFPDEAFWWTGDASITLASGGTADLILGMEAAFANGPVNAGDQISFGRIRLKMLTPPAVGTYTFTHPFGVQQITVGLDPLTGRPEQIRNVGFDIGAIGVPFQGILLPFTAPAPDTVSFGPFLRWDTDFPQINPANGKQYVGNPTVPHTVTGSPFGTNFFRVQGPVGSNLGGPGVDVVETSLFTVSGKIVGLDVRPGTSFSLGAVIMPATSAPQTVTVTNTTANPIAFGAIAPSGVDAIDFAISPPTAAGAVPCTNATLTAAAPGNSCSFNIDFTPTAVARAARTATIALAPLTVQPAPPPAVQLADPPPVTLNLGGTAQVLVTASGVGHGTITPDSQAVGAGTAVTFTVTPSSKKFKVKQVSDGPAIVAGPPFTINVGTANHTVSASFMASGDADGNGVLDLADALKALKIVAGVQAADADDPDNTAINVAPLSGGVPAPDASVDIGDVLVILRRVLNLDTW